MSHEVILPGATLGVMGGGQLGRMFVHAAQRMGYSTAVLDPDASSPAGLVSHRHVHADYLDDRGLAELAQCSAAITTEFENVPAPALAKLAAHRPVAPGAEAVAIAQDRLLEKSHFVKCGVPCAPHAAIETPEQLHAVDADLLPGVLKTARLGYDGKGQVRVQTRDELIAAWHGLQGVPCVLEKLLPLAAECSVIVGRGRDGAMVNLPPQLNLHRGGILAVTEVHEGNLEPSRAALAVESTRAIAQGLGYVGVLCVEFFVLADGSLVVNEMAPRPHNSGHYSMDACDVSQFELQVRTLAGLPLAAEMSVIVARGRDGAMVHFPPQLNLHREGILAVTEVFAGNVPPPQAMQAVAATKSIAEGLDYCGVLCVEFFVLGDGSLVVNEMAPRPHNSGHYTIDACDLSQFDLQVRTLAGLPLVQPRQHSPAFMLNLLGDLWFTRGASQATPDWAAVLALPGVHLHLYGKHSARPGRKMGHVTVTGPSVQATRDTALRIAFLLGIDAF